MLEFVALCTAGLEQAPCIELKQLGYKIQKTTSGHIHFRAELRDTAILNMKLKSADRILIHVGSFEARSFNQLYDGTFSLNWKELISKRANLKVHKVKIRNSNLSATGAVASVVKKAIYTKISPETSDQQKIEYPIHIYIKNNIVSLMIDTTGKYALSRRGYRTKTSRAPLRETIAAALIIVSHWKNETLLIDPFCGSGTIPIEAALIASDALSVKRTFVSQNWPILQREWKHVAKELSGYQIDRIVAIGYDKDCSVIKTARENARRAEVSKNILFECRRFEELQPLKDHVHVVTNPPFGVRLDEGDAKFYRSLSKIFTTFPKANVCVITPRPNLEKLLKHRAKRKFRFQNSGLWTWCYIFKE